MAQYANSTKCGKAVVEELWNKNYMTEGNQWGKEGPLDV